MKKIKLIIILSLLLTVVTFPRVSADDVNGELYNINDQTVLKIWGTHSERGYAYGYLQSDAIIDVMKNYIIWSVFMNSSYTYGIARTYFEDHFGIEQKYYDESQGMITGIEESGGNLYSSVLGRDLDNIDVLVSNSIIDLSAILPGMGDIMNCASISSWGESTIADPQLAGESIITRLLDWTPYQTLLDNQLMIVSIPAESDEQSWVSFAFAGLMGSLSGINEDGVSAFMNVGNNDNHPNIDTLHPIWLSIRNGIEDADYNDSGECNPQDVADAIADKLQLSDSITHSICSTTNDSFAIVIECNNQNGTVTRNVNDNTVIPGDNLAVTNHFRKLYSPVYCSRYENIVDSLNISTDITSDRSWDLLCGAAGNLGNMQAIQFIPRYRKNPLGNFTGCFKSCLYSDSR